MLNYEIAPALLRSFVPRGTELDQWRGRSFVSIVGFMFLKTRLLGVAIPFHENFEEINLRFYVRRSAPDGWRRGVVFIKEIVPRWAIATVARIAYNENYEARRMRHKIEPNLVEYEWRDGQRWNAIRATMNGEPQSLHPGSEEEFITEHYWGYAGQRDGGAVEYRVEHPPWRVWQVGQAEFDCDVRRVYGERFVECLSVKPSSAFVAEGSEITVRRGRRI